MLVGKTIRRAVDALRVPTGDSAWHGSIGVGVAARNEAMATPTDLIKAADEGVYAANQAGKNCIRSHS